MMPPTKHDTLPYIIDLYDAYVDYCRSVSLRAMAINLETAATLWWACDTVNARTVCDLGSGFTSYTIRRYAQTASHPVEVVSVDDSDQWLKMTVGYLNRHRMPATGVITYDVWSGTDDQFDVIIHDFNAGDVRNRVMWEAAERLSPGGVMVVDDMQHDGHRAELDKIASFYHWPNHAVQSVTTDESGQYAGMVTA